MTIIYDTPPDEDRDELFRCWSCWRLMNNGLTAAGQTCPECEAAEKAAARDAVRARLTETITDIVTTTARRIA
jgi:hypothetical protein